MTTLKEALLTAALDASSRGFISGTTNWVAFVAASISAAPAPQAQPEPTLSKDGVITVGTHVYLPRGSVWQDGKRVDKAQPVAAQGEPLNLAREVLKLNAMWNKSTIKAPAIADQLGVCRVLAERVQHEH